MLYESRASAGRTRHAELYIRKPKPMQLYNEVITYPQLCWLHDESVCRDASATRKKPRILARVSRDDLSCKAINLMTASARCEQIIANGYNNIDLMAQGLGANLGAIVEFTFWAHAAERFLFLLMCYLQFGIARLRLIRKLFTRIT